jgi:hypothetical protein
MGSACATRLERLPANGPLSFVLISIFVGVPTHLHQPSLTMTGVPLPSPSPLWGGPGWGSRLGESHYPHSLVLFAEDA